MNEEKMEGSERWQRKKGSGGSELGKVRVLEERRSRGETTMGRGEESEGVKRR